MGEVSNSTAPPAVGAGKPHIAMPGGGGDVNCPGCHAPVSKSSKFCGQCGTRLWEPCLDCSELNSVSERFCGGCGSDLAARLAAMCADVEGKLAQADNLAEIGKLIDAAQILEQITLAEHTHLAEFRSTIAARIAQYRTQRDTVVEQASLVLETVKNLMADVRYADALDKAKKIPPAMRNAELSDLHDQLQQKVFQAERLSEQLQTGVKSKQYDGLAALAKQLAELVPHDKAVQKLLGQLEAWQAKTDGKRATQYIAAAAEALRECAYRKAGALLAKVTVVEDPELEKKFRAAKERVWLATQLTHEPYASAATVAAAARLLKLQPHDAKVQKLAGQLGQRWKATQNSPNGVPASWIDAPGGGPLAEQVELCPLPEVLVAQAKALKHSAHEFTIAYGLALQAAGLAAVPLDLLPSTKGGWRDKLKLGGSRKVKPRCWGLDLGGHALTAVRIDLPDDKEAAPEIGELVQVPYEQHSDASPPARDGALSDSVQEAVRKFAESVDLAASRTTLSLSGPQTLGRFFELPVPTPSKFKQAVEYEARARVPLPAEDVVFDFHAHDLPPDEDAEVAKRWVTLVAANRDQVAKRAEIFGELGCSQLQVASSSVALLNVALAEGGVAADRPALERGVALVDVGGSSTNLIVVTPAAIWFRGLYLGGDGMVKAVAKELKIDRAAARKYCKRPDAAPWMHQVDEALSGYYGELSEHLRRSLEQCRGELGVDIQRVLVTGSWCGTLGLVRHLRSGE